MNIHDIAQLAGVSKSTVSRYLNGGSISEKTRLKIEKIVQETGYSPNQFAQALKAKRTQMIGVIVPRLNSFASNETLLGIETYLRERHYQTLIVNTDLNQSRELDAIYTLAKNKVDGIILLATVISQEHVKAIQDVQIPLLLVGQSHEIAHSIVQNDYEAGLCLGRLFGRHDFEKIAYLGVTESDKAVGIHRKRGVIDGLKSFNMTADIYETSFDITETADIAADIVADYEAVICATDNIALGTLMACQQKGIKVPERLSLAGFGGYETVQLVTPAITTIAFPYRRTGEDSAASLLNMINGISVDKLHIMDYKMIQNSSIDNKRWKK